MSNRPAHTQPSSQAETLDRFRCGDRDAFLAVYDAYAEEVRATARRYFVTPFDREEAVQEAWLQVHRSCHMFDINRGTIGGWLQAVTVNRCRELLRARRRRPQPGRSLQDEDLPSSSDPESSARARRLQQAVDRFAMRLGREEAAVLRLSLIEEQSHGRVAQAVGITVRRCKYLRMKLLLRAASDRDLRQALKEVAEP